MRKPKIIPKGFIWDPKAKELVDVRANNPKLRKLMRESIRVDIPAICISPFYRVTNQQPPNNTFKQSKKKEDPWHHYQTIPLLVSNRKTQRMLLGRHCKWTIKEDGENITIWKRKVPHTRKQFEIIISSHNQEIAAEDIRGKVATCPEYTVILQIIEDNPTYRIVVEECRKGLSVTRIKTYERAILYVVDIYDSAIKNYLPYTNVYQLCYHYKIPCVALFSETRHKTLRDLHAYMNHVLEHCIAVHEEGMVVKAFTEDGEYIQGKVKQDTPKPTERIIHEGAVQLPQIPESEIMGAISHVEADFGLTGDPKHDMPLIAKSVGGECRKHLYSGRGNLFTFYQDYMNLAGKRKK